MYPSSVMAASGARLQSVLQLSSVTGLRHWFLLHRLCVSDFSGLLDDVGRPGGVRAANDGNFPKVYGEVDSKVFRKKVCCWLQ